MTAGGGEKRSAERLQIPAHKQSSEIKYEQALRGLFTAGTSRFRLMKNERVSIGVPPASLERIPGNQEKVGGKLGLKHMVEHPCSVHITEWV